MTVPDFEQIQLTDLLGHRYPDGYLDVVAITDAGPFELLRNEVRHAAERNLTSFSSLLPNSWKNCTIEEGWTDGDTLFLFVDRRRCIVYEFVLPDAMGVAEVVRFVDDHSDVERIRQYLSSEPDSSRVVVSQSKTS